MRGGVGLESWVSELLSGMTRVYSEQLAFYERLYEMTLLEQSAILAGDAVGLAELLHLEDEVIFQARQLEEVQRGMREMLQSVLPVRHLGMDQLACLTEPKIYIKFEQVLAALKTTLARAEEQKKQNILAMREKSGLLSGRH